MSLLSILLLVFVAMKLCGLITWSWFWVISPLWVPLATAALALMATSLWAMVRASAVYGTVWDGP